jgi:cytochrome P450
MKLTLGDSMFQRDPWPTYVALRQQGDVVFFPEAGTYLVTGYAEVKAGLSNPALGSGHPLRVSKLILGPNMLDTDGAGHRALRRAINPFFGASAVKRLQERVLPTIIDDVIARVREFGTEPFDFVTNIAIRMPYQVMVGVLGIPEADADWVYRTLRPIVAALDYPPPAPDTIATARDELVSYCQSLLSTPTISDAAGSATTIVTQLTQLTGAGTLTRAQALSTTMLMFIATTETSIAAITNIMYCYRRWPDMFTEDQIASCVRESLRLYSPLQSVSRFAKHHTVIGDVTIERHRPVMLVLAAANRDERVFQEPTAFIPQRDLRQAISFGSGAHTCPGMFLAETEFRALFTALLDKFMFVEAETEADESFAGHVFCRPRSLWLRAKPDNNQMVS